MIEYKIAEAQVLSLEDVKHNLRIDADDEDAARDRNILQCAAAAEEIVLKYCNTSWNEVIDDYFEVPAAIYRAAMSIACTLYQEPTGMSTRQVFLIPFHLQSSLNPFVKLTKRVSDD